jgi:hypothetical protein
MKFLKGIFNITLHYATVRRIMRGYVNIAINNKS